MQWDQNATTDGQAMDKAIEILQAVKDLYTHYGFRADMPVFRALAWMRARRKERTEHALAGYPPRGRVA